MRYTEPLSNQVLMFISSIGPGILIGLIYDVVFSFIRASSDKKVFIIISDVSFSLVATLISFFYMVIYNSGTVRLNIILAQLIGAAAFHYTLGKYVSVPVSFLGNTLRKLLGLCFKPFAVACAFAGKKLSAVGDKLKNMARYRKNNVHLREKIKNIIKIDLKK